MQQYRNHFISLSCSLFLYIIVTIFQPDNKDNLLISIASGLFMYIILLFAGTNLNITKESFQDVEPILIGNNTLRKPKQKKPKWHKYNHVLSCEICNEIAVLLQNEGLDTIHDDLLHMYNEVIQLNKTITKPHNRCTDVLLANIERLHKKRLIQMKYTSCVPSQKLYMIFKYNIPIGSNVTAIKLLNAITDKIEKHLQTLMMNDNIRNDRIKKRNEEFYVKYYRGIIEQCTTSTYT